MPPRDLSRLLRHKKATRPRLRFGNPIDTEGSNGDTTVRSTADGIVFYIKYQNRWRGVKLDKASEQIEKLARTGGVDRGKARIGKDVSINYAKTRVRTATITCSLSDDTDANVAHRTPAFKIPAYSVIKSVGCIVTKISNLGTYNLALYVGTDILRTDGQALTSGVEILGAGEATTMSAGSSSATNIAAGSGDRIKVAWYSRPDIAFGTVDKYVYAVMGASGNGDTNPSASAVLKVSVDFIGHD